MVIFDGRSKIFHIQNKNNFGSMIYALPKSLMIYGAIGFNYKSKLAIVKGSIYSSNYQTNIIKSVMIQYLDNER